MATDDQISQYKSALTSIAQAQDSDFCGAALPLLIARDKVALALRDETDPPAPASLDLLIKTDRQLTELASKFETLVGSETLDSWRHSVEPDENAWWWKLEELATKNTKWKRVSTVVAVVLVIASFGLIADTFNLMRAIGANPVSTIGALIQGALGFIAASAFTESGRKWFADKFSHPRWGKRTFKGWARTLLAVLVLVFTLGIRFLVPTSTASYFQWQGDRYYREGLYIPAAHSFQQAAALKPYSISHHIALAKANEKAGEYVRAIAEYKTAIALYERRAQSVDDAYFFGKCELIRLLICHDKNYGLATNLADDVQKKISQVTEPNRNVIQYFVLTYQGWIDLENENYETAKSELVGALALCNGPVAHFLLARVFEEMKANDEATKEFSQFLEAVRNPGQFEEAEPEWISYAQERTLNNV
ncbi:MAG: tetratricopeptide repeat protein [Pyrinomonadaceae bacterium]